LNIDLYAIKDVELGSRNSTRNRARQRPGENLSIERLEARLAMAGVVISEFLASNTTGIADEDGQRQDWIELHNASAAAVNLAGWRLTDDAGDLGKFVLPATTLAAGERLTVFASGKNRSAAGSPLHTNFSLLREGEYLALVMPDGATVASEFAPYPQQIDDVSYGAGTDPSMGADQTLVGATSPLKVISPSGENAAVDDHWREVGFDDAAWLDGVRSVGFDRDGTNDFGPYVGRTLTAGEMPSTGAPRYTAYVRYKFDVENVEQFDALALSLRFDDGFIAYINGREVARANFGEDFARTQPQWDSRAGYQMGSSSSLGAVNRGADALLPTEFDLSAFLPLLVNGENVLAFHVVNSASTSGSGSGQDLLLEPVLTARRTGGVQVGYLPAPTPGEANGVSTLGFVEDTQFSVDRGFFDGPIQVAIATATPGATIRYTTDGSVPSATAGQLYAGPITVSTTTILRAAAFKPGYAPTNVDTQTYIFLADVINQSAADVTQPYAPWGHDKEDADTTSGYNLDDEADWEMDPQIVSAHAATIIDDLKSIPTMSLAMNWDDLFGGAPLPGTPAGSGAAAPAPQGIYVHGASSERAASLEYFNPFIPTDQVQADVAVEMQGHSSTLRWNTDKMSFQVKFKFPYGATELEHPLFAGSTDGADATSQFDTLILDAMFNYSWTHQNPVQRNFARFVTDQVVSDLQNLASGDGAPHGKYVHLYLNGLYWGIYNVHERPDDSFAAEYFGGDKDDYYVVKSTNNDVAHEYSWVEGGVAAEQNFGQLLDATRSVEANAASAPHYAAVQAALDVDRFIDYMVVHYYAGNGNDWSHNNWYATRNAIAGQWRFHAWDQEHAFPTTDNGDSWTQTSDLTGKDDFEAPTEIHRNLMANAEYRLRFADRVQELMHNGGVLTPDAARAVYQARTSEIDRAIVGESARWGDNRVANDPYTRDDFLAITAGVVNNFFPVRTGAVLGHFDAAGWIPALDAPLLSQYGGEISPGFSLSMSKPPGAPAGAVIYYTTDGSDPRLPGGGLNPAAIAYGGPVNLASSTRVQARVFFDAAGAADDWSPLVDKTFAAANAFPLRMVELHYNPAPQAGVVDEQDMEFIELLNTGSSAISLDGVQIAGFASEPYTFASGLVLAAGERIIVARNPTVFAGVYGGAVNVAPGGYGNANLSNGGETVVLLGPAGETIQNIAYSDDAPWPANADGGGPSLEIIDPLGDPNDPANWRASDWIGGSPGSPGTPATPGDFDGDQDADGADFLAWQRGVGLNGAERADGDADGDQDVDGADLALWRGNFGTTPAAPVVAALNASPAAAIEQNEFDAAFWTNANAWLVAPDAVHRQRDQSAVRRRAADEIFAQWTAVRLEIMPAALHSTWTESGSSLSAGETASESSTPSRAIDSNAMTAAVARLPISLT
jgi:hypothetical protein